MDDDACFVEYIEIVPVDDYKNCSESSDVELSPCHIKVCMLYVHCLCVVTVIFCFRNICVSIIIQLLTD